MIMIMMMKMMIIKKDDLLECEERFKGFLSFNCSLKQRW